MNQVWVTGDAVVDLIPESETSLLKCPGGAPANVAVAIARLSGKSAFFGRVGDDCLLYTSPSPRDRQKSRMPSSA